MTPLNSVQFNNLKRRADAIVKKHPYIRQGQAMMNVLADMSPEWYNAITATENDPFYRDDRIPKFIETVVDFFM